MPTVNVTPTLQIYDARIVVCGCGYKSKALYQWGANDRAMTLARRHAKRCSLQAGKKVA